MFGCEVLAALAAVTESVGCLAAIENPRPSGRGDCENVYLRSIRPGVDRKRVTTYGMRRRDGIGVRVAAGGSVSSFPDQSYCRMQDRREGWNP